MTFEDISLAGVARPLWALLAGVGVVLLIACTNVADLLLARGTARLPELAIRAAIGASRARIIRQGMTEGIVLAVIGGVVGVTLGTIGVRAFLGLASADIARLDQVRLDRTVLAFTTIIVIVTGVLFGLASTQIAVRRPVALTMRGSATAASGRQLRQWMIGIEAGLAMLLLVVAVLLSSAFYQLSHTDLGFDPRGLIAVSFQRTPAPFRSAERLRVTERELVTRLGAIPGVRAAAATSVAPLGERGRNIPMTVVGRPDQSEGAVEWRAVSREYAGGLGLSLGRSTGSGGGQWPVKRHTGMRKGPRACGGSHGSDRASVCVPRSAAESAPRAAARRDGNKANRPSTRRGRVCSGFPAVSGTR